MRAIVQTINNFFRAEEDTFARDFTLAMVGVGTLLPVVTIATVRLLMGVL